MYTLNQSSIEAQVSISYNVLEINRTYNNINTAFVKNVCRAYDGNKLLAMCDLLFAD